MNMSDEERGNRARKHMVDRLNAARAALQQLEVDLNNETHQTEYVKITDEDAFIRFADMFSGVARACELARFMLGTNETNEEVGP